MVEGRANGWADFVREEDRAEEAGVGESSSMEVGGADVGV